ncbi:hypothetical protein [Sphingobium sp. Ant17]|uniref:hypothetical protein n=1 Tax=Sphingobium sp. Ant17 TaxID=1461752 RepID=UPI00044B2FDC|nr:hypothetical protein [Sphingobium sp. Ant17]EXS69222.1 hypothetical protein BF95_24800 [Sphingobium sp. Ant17]OHC96958.1 MAG: hypothetical protein A2095_02365 [Sphingomonadales bacterium GWF1_63_6]
MTKTSRNPAYRRYTRRMIPISLAYVGAVGLASRLIPDNAAANGATVAIALVPGLAALGWIWAMARLLVELDDEYLRMLEVRKFLIATGFALSITSVWGVLELFTTVPALPVFFVWPLWCVGLALGQLVNWRQTGVAGCA